MGVCVCVGMYLYNIKNGMYLYNIKMFRTYSRAHVPFRRPGGTAVLH